ncbi:MAG TPA: M28 family peptidase [Gemmatimonadaceae bacterium]|nr:M28 family peptidase [Gemmatimonadaceae bacterium]
MSGRAVGTVGNVRATAYIERQLAQLGVRPAGEDGGYFQALPLARRAFDTASTIEVGDVVFRGGADFVAGVPLFVGPPLGANSSASPHQFTSVPFMYGGYAFDTSNVLTPDETRGRIVLLRAFVPPPGFDQRAFTAVQQTPAFARYVEALRAAAGVALVSGDTLSRALIRRATTVGPVIFLHDEPGYPSLSVTRRLADALLGVPLASARKGMIGVPATSHIRFVDTPTPVGRNVIGVIPGTDPKLRHEYVVLSAHSDHLGVRPGPPVDHDSVKAFMEVVRPEGADSPPARPTTTQEARIRMLIDSLHRAHGGARPDSIYNGADDDGSGSVSLLAIAEAVLRAHAQPKRSLLFVWHTGEEPGLWGSEYFTDHPTVPRDSIVADLNIDMVGRGDSSDVTGRTKSGLPIHGGLRYVQLVGARRLSTELGDIVERVNQRRELNLVLDYTMDAPGHPEMIYCRSDHYEYARFGIPVAFFTTGGNADYHQVTDEAQYIDYDHMTLVDRFILAVAETVASLDHRPRVDGSPRDVECGE